MRKLFQPRGRPAAPATAFGIACAFGLFASARLDAADYPLRKVDGWTVAESKTGDGCFLTRNFGEDGSTSVLLGLDLANANHFTVLNPGWSIKKGTPLVLDFRLSNASYPQQSAIGIVSPDKQGFVTSFDAVFPARFAASRFLHIRRGDVPVEELSLAGSGAAIAELRRCVDLSRKSAAAGSRPRSGSTRIPKDPFAPDLEKQARR